MNAAAVIPKKTLTAWEKWEIGDLESPENRQHPEPAQPAPPPSPQETPAAPAASAAPEAPEAAKPQADTPALPTAEQIEQIYQQAREEGMLEGYQAGKAQAVQEIEAEVERLQTLLSAFEQALHKMDETVAQDLLTLSIELARKMVGRALQVKPEYLLTIVEEALQQLPAQSRSLHIALHPDDAALVREHLTRHLSHAKWRIVEDAHVAPGGCRMESAGCEVDATLPTRWQRVLAPLGKTPDWLV
ncbi:flagellar assembly protein FliH [Nitrosomonas halophila]|jgi:flagellar assembly protein FliH|uniref:Flagellar assembly protein FliH n=1 Tax=Nitrosomonas halophila TaxID=44576 RepID=A0A1H3K8F9_9PROT|nr:flagellar assembly protein FliH [Nitrosomonas halophila]SDY48085.1 flagellar assembly protein FliH [Nitrosomonas halophila]